MHQPPRTLRLACAAVVAAVCVALAGVCIAAYQQSGAVLQAMTAEGRARQPSVAMATAHLVLLWPLSGTHTHTLAYDRPCTH